METGNNKFNALTEQNENNDLRLSARLKADSFFYSIFDSNIQMWLYDSIKITDIDALNKIGDLAHDFKSVSIALDSETKTQVDKHELDSSENDSLFFNQLQTSPHQGLYNRDNLNNNGIINIYPVDNPKLDILLEKFPNAKLSHLSSCLMNFAAEYIDTAVYGHISEDTIHISYIKDKNIILHNQYSIIDENDILYFISLIYQEFHIDNNSIPLVLSGDIYSGYASYKLLQNYFKHIEFPVMEGFSRAKELSEIIPSHYFDQYSIIRCE